MKNLDLIKLPFSKENPILVQVLGVCSCLAVTAQLKPAVVMSLHNVINDRKRNCVMPIAPENCKSPNEMFLSIT